MANSGNHILNKGIPKLKDAFVVIVKTEWNHLIVNKLSSGCKKILKNNNVLFKEFTVPGAFELTFVIKQLSEKYKNADAFIAFGTVIRGNTPHFDYVCKAVTDGIVSLNIVLDVPTIFGVLTLENQQQAVERVGGKHGHKGEEAAITAIKMIHLNRSITK